MCIISVGVDVHVCRETKRQTAFWACFFRCAKHMQTGHCQWETRQAVNLEHWLDGGLKFGAAPGLRNGLAAFAGSSYEQGSTIGGTQQTNHSNKEPSGFMSPASQSKASQAQVRFQTAKEQAEACQRMAPWLVATGNLTSFNNHQGGELSHVICPRIQVLVFNTRASCCKALKPKRMFPTGYELAPWSEAEGPRSMDVGHQCSLATHFGLFESRGTPNNEW